MNCFPTCLLRTICSTDVPPSFSIVGSCFYANSLLLYSFNWLLPMGIRRSTCFLLRCSGSTYLPILSICITVQQANHEKTLAIPGNGALLPFGEFFFDCQRGKGGGSRSPPDYVFRMGPQWPSLKQVLTYSSDRWIFRFHTVEDFGVERKTTRRYSAFSLSRRFEELFPGLDNMPLLRW